MATNGYFCYSSYHLYLPHIHIGKAEVRIAITDLGATILHGVAAHCNRIFFRLFLSIIFCEFSLHILVNYMKNQSFIEYPHRGTLHIQHDICTRKGLEITENECDGKYK